MLCDINKVIVTQLCINLCSFLSSCSDKKESARAPGLYFSFQGCKGKLLQEPQPAISEPQQEEPRESVTTIEP